MIPRRSDVNFFSKSKNVKELVASDFDPASCTKLKKKECCVIMFYAPWCPHCQNMKDVWEKVGQQAVFFKVYAVNCEKQRKLITMMQEDDPEFIKFYPTIVIYNKGNPVKKVEDRNVAALVNVVMNACKNQS